MLEDLWTRSKNNVERTRTENLPDINVHTTFLPYFECFDPKDGHFIVTNVIFKMSSKLH